MAFFLPSLKKNGCLDPVHVTLCNVGSRKTGTKDDYGTQAWGMFAPNLTIYGFDADADACEAANADVERRELNWIEQHIPLAIAKEVGTSTLYITNNPQCSSLYPPNAPYLKRFLRLQEMVALESTTDIETTNLDTVFQTEGIDEIDFLQIDVQGASLQVLEGASWLLERSVLAIQVEVEFSHLYANEPLFADVDTYLRRQGFTLFDLAPLSRGQRSQLHSTERPGQVLWADAIYVRDLLQEDTNAQFKSPDQLFKLACIADALEFTDYALELLEYLTLHYGNDPIYNVANHIVESLTQIPALVQAGLSTFPAVTNLQDYITGAAADFLAANPPPASITYASPVESFNSAHYLQHNQKRQAHLASLNLNLTGMTVLEVGAGIGDHTPFFLDRGCQVVSTEGRQDNFELLKQRYPDLDTMLLDLDDPGSSLDQTFDIVYCYGLLYHLQNPTEAIAFMANHCQGLVLLETVVSFDQGEALNPCSEPADSPTQSITGQGCRPTRLWVYNQLKKHFAFVYMPITQPDHEEFPTDWSADLTRLEFKRAVFIASREPLSNPLLKEDIPMRQSYH